jgi:hypothetical protein
LLSPVFYPQKKDSLSWSSYFSMGYHYKPVLNHKGFPIDVSYSEWQGNMQGRQLFHKNLALNYKIQSTSQNGYYRHKKDSLPADSSRSVDTLLELDYQKREKEILFGLAYLNQPGGLLNKIFFNWDMLYGLEKESGSWGWQIKVDMEFKSHTRLKLFHWFNRSESSLYGEGDYLEPINLLWNTAQEKYQVLLEQSWFWGIKTGYQFELFFENPDKSGTILSIEEESDGRRHDAWINLPVSKFFMTALSGYLQSSKDTLTFFNDNQRFFSGNAKAQAWGLDLEIKLQYPDTTKNSWSAKVSHGKSRGEIPRATLEARAIVPPSAYNNLYFLPGDFFYYLNGSEYNWSYIGIYGSGKFVWNNLSVNIGNGFYYSETDQHLNLDEYRQEFIEILDAGYSEESLSFTELISGRLQLQMETRLSSIAIKIRGSMFYPIWAKKKSKFAGSGIKRETDMSGGWQAGILLEKNF